MKNKNSFLAGFLILLFIVCFAVGHKALAADNVTYSGTIKNGNGVAVPGLSVTLTDRATSLDYVSELTDADGAFSVSVPPGEFNLILRNVNYDVSVPVFTRIVMRRLTVNVNTVQDLVIPAKSVNLTVLSSTSHPAYASVEIRQTAANTNTFELYPGSRTASVAGNDWTSTAYTDQSGVAVLTYFPSSGAFVNLTPGYGIVRDSLLRDFLDDSPQTINLSGVHSLSGVVKDGEGAVVRGMFIKLRNEATLETYSSLLTADDGAFITSAPDGTYSLVMTNNDDAPPLPNFDDIVMPGFVLSGSDMIQDLTVPARSVSITILDPYGQPAKGYVLIGKSAETTEPFVLYPGGPEATMSGTAWGSYGYSDETGITSAMIFAGHDLDVTVTPDWSSDRHFGVNKFTRDILDFSPLTVSMSMLHSISGVVRSADGVPVPGMYVITYVNADILTNYSDITGSDGAYTVYQPSGTYTLSVKNRDLNPLVPIFDGIIMPGLVIPDGDVVHDLTVPSQTVSISVLDSLTQPFSASVQLKQDPLDVSTPVVLYPDGPPASVDNWRSQTAHTDENGNANVIFFPGQNVRVRVNPNGNRLNTVDYYRDFADNTPQTITFKTIFNITGVIKDGNGNPLAGITATLAKNGLTVATAAGPTGADGVYLITDVPFDTYRLNMEDEAVPHHNKVHIGGVEIYSDVVLDPVFVPTP